MAENGATSRVRLEEEERTRLQAGAALSTDKKLIQREHHLDPDDFRTEFHRDYTRIIHSRAFRRLRHKTQVFIHPQNDHLCTRLEHSLHVASVAMTIARALRLNEDLVTAIAVGHDLGHAPFGHKGEKSLNALVKRHGLSFSHELHSLRLVDHLESPYREYAGLNLTFAVRDGIACHYGEGFELSLSPDRDKSPDSLLSMVSGEARPMTLEGCVVRWADKVAYLGRDLEDALTLSIIRQEDIPGIVRERLGTTNREIIANLVHELALSGDERDCISIRTEMHDALNEFYQFNMKSIYQTDEATRHYKQIDRAVVFLFEFLCTRLDEADGDIKPFESAQETCLKIFAQFLEEDVRNWQTESAPQLVLDFIAGMTDSFFVNSFTELFLPRSSV